MKMRRCFTDPHYWKNPALRRSREKDKSPQKLANIYICHPMYSRASACQSMRVSTNSLVSLRAHASDRICTSVLPGKLNDDVSCQLLSFPGVSA